MLASDFRCVEGLHFKDDGHFFFSVSRFPGSG